MSNLSSLEVVVGFVDFDFFPTVCQAFGAGSVVLPRRLVDCLAAMLCCLKSKKKSCCCVVVLPYFLCYKTVFLSFPNNQKNLDPSYKMDLDLWDC